LKEKLVILRYICLISAVAVRMEVTICFCWIRKICHFK